MVSAISAISGNSGNHGFYRPRLHGALRHYAARHQVGLSHDDDITTLRESATNQTFTATGSGIKYKTNQINGMPAIDFGATSQVFTGGTSGISGNPEMAVFIVGAATAATIRRVFQVGAIASTNGTVKSFGLNAPSFRSNGWNRIFNSPTNPADWHIYTFINIANATVSDHRCFVDGIELTQASGSNLASIPNLTDEETIIGGGRSAGTLGNYFTGLFSEIVLVNRIRQDILNYHNRSLGRIFGLTTTDIVL